MKIFKCKVGFNRFNRNNIFYGIADIHDIYLTENKHSILLCDRADRNKEYDFEIITETDGNNNIINSKVYNIIFKFSPIDIIQFADTIKSIINDKEASE